MQALLDLLPPPTRAKLQPALPTASTRWCASTCWDDMSGRRTPQPAPVGRRLPRPALCGDGAAVRRPRPARPGPTSEIEAVARDRDGVVGQMVQPHRRPGPGPGGDGPRPGVAAPPLPGRRATSRPARSSPPSCDSPGPLGPSATGPRPCCAAASRRWKAFNLAVAQGNLATLLKDEGKLDEALATYEARVPHLRGAGRPAADGGGAERR